ncbi:hypothetical protein R1sor_025863 [Riccia sorocarpa]|uniref:Uncharacterized protein n=1 Tax=Riccia sorocarpa TaxID=122646 RepID=A0ABD3G9U5_9MARC
MAPRRPIETEKGNLSCTQFKNLILDVGGVLLQPNLDLNYGTAVSPLQFKRISSQQDLVQISDGQADMRRGLCSTVEVDGQLFPSGPSRILWESKRGFEDLHLVCYGHAQTQLDLFEHVLAEPGIEPSETVCLDDDLANVSTSTIFVIADLLGDERFLPIESPPKEGTINFLRTSRGGNVTRSIEEFILNPLQHRGYRRGTVYYNSPEVVLV